ncbi:Lar family restriction alleviation protein [Acetobacter sp. KSO5]|uniref:Lar family restriction alleviation protein n=1 Tax=Acetobacter sp. KSO5 TaxID=3373674 RepID=UPI00376EABF1
MSEELKACPNCGSRNVHVTGEHWFFCVCDDCDQSSPLEKTFPEAIAAWNTRAGEKV